MNFQLGLSNTPVVKLASNSLNLLNTTSMTGVVDIYNSGKIFCKTNNTIGNINTGSTGFCCYFDSSNYLNMYNDLNIGQHVGGVNVIQSIGKTLLINPGSLPDSLSRDVELFNVSDSKTTSVFNVNGEISLGPGNFSSYGQAAPRRSIKIFGSSTQGSFPFLELFDNTGPSIFLVNRSYVLSNNKIIIKPVAVGGLYKYMEFLNSGPLASVIADLRFSFSLVDGVNENFEISGTSPAGSANPGTFPIIKFNRTNFTTTLSGPLSVLTLDNNTLGNVTSGSYIAVISASTNTSSPSRVTSLYQRIGNVVNVSVNFTFIPTVFIANTPYEITISLPINTNATYYSCFTATGDNQLLGFATYNSISTLTCKVSTPQLSDTSSYRVFVTGNYLLN